MNKRSRWVIVFGILLSSLALLATRISTVRATFDVGHAVQVYLRVEAELMPKTPAGRHYVDLYYKHLCEIFQIIDAHPEHNETLVQAFVLFAPELEALLDGEGDRVYISSQHVTSLQAELDWFASRGSQALREDIQKERQLLSLDQFVDMTMNQAWEYINSKWTPDMVVQPAATGIPVATATPITHNRITEAQTKWVTDHNIVPGSNGKWAYYLHNGVYFEYPASYHIYVSPNSLHFTTPQNVVNWNDPTSITVDILTVDKKDKLTPSAWFSTAPRNVVWQRTLPGREFEGTEYILVAPIRENDVICTLGALLYNQENELGLHIQVKGITPSTEDFALLSQEYEYFHHMMDNVRIQRP